MDLNLDGNRWLILVGIVVFGLLLTLQFGLLKVSDADLRNGQTQITNLIIFAAVCIGAYLIFHHFFLPDKESLITLDEILSTMRDSPREWVRITYEQLVTHYVIDRDNDGTGYVNKNTLGCLQYVSWKKREGAPLNLPPTQLMIVEPHRFPNPPMPDRLLNIGESDMMFARYNVDNIVDLCNRINGINSKDLRAQMAEHILSGKIDESHIPNVLGGLKELPRGQGNVG